MRRVTDAARIAGDEGIGLRSLSHNATAIDATSSGAISRRRGQARPGIETGSTRTSANIRYPLFGIVSI